MPLTPAPSTLAASPTAPYCYLHATFTGRHTCSKCRLAVYKAANTKRCVRCDRVGTATFTTTASGDTVCMSLTACLKRRSAPTGRTHALTGVHLVSGGWVGACICGGWDLSRWPSPSRIGVRAAFRDHRAAAD